MFRGALGLPESHLEAAMRVRIFIDYWNFQLTWNERGDGKRCDWAKLPMVLCQEAGSVLAAANLAVLSLEETRVYAGYEAGREANLKTWLHNFLDRQPGIRVFSTERHWKERPVHCRSCDTEHTKCPTCGAAFGRAGEKTIDAKIVTDLIGLAWENAYDAAILVSADGDFIPAVEHVQGKNYKVINAAWHGVGNELAKVCWASFDIDRVILKLARSTA